MNNGKVTILRNIVQQRFLPFVQRPGRYIGGEVNQIKKDLDNCEVKVALCFPDVYEIAMSNTAISILYNILNQMPNVAAERLFAPWTDAEKILRDKNIPLYTLESMAAAGDFDLLGFSLNSELCYTNVLNVLDLAQIPIRTDQRTQAHPLIVAGGLTANCAEPIAEFIDMFILGDGEETVVELVNFLKDQKKANATREQILSRAAQDLDFVYVPSLYSFDYEDDKIISFAPESPTLPRRFESAVVKDLDNTNVPEAPIVPFVQAVHERVSVEIMRGCPGRCGFCQASFCKRPLRFRSIEKILEIAKQNYLTTGYDTVSLLSLSTADYPYLEELVARLQEYFIPKHVGLSLPSLRVKQQLKLLPKLVASVRKSGLTIAVEAASERLRQFINKPISDHDLMAGIEAAYNAGFQKIKLYFMVGFETETDQDIENIAELSYAISALRKKVDGRFANVNVTVSWLVPKPHTPFGWFPQKPEQYFERAKKLILDKKRQLRAKFLQFKFHNIQQSILESALARGDRRLADVIEAAWRNGARFDLWDECFNFDIWVEAFRSCRGDVDRAAQKSFTADEILPWEHLGGPDKQYLLKHFNKAMEFLDRG